MSRQILTRKSQWSHLRNHDALYKHQIIVHTFLVVHSPVTRPAREDLAACRAAGEVAAPAAGFADRKRQVRLCAGAVVEGGGSLACLVWAGVRG